jgi:small conductance mechanosensitive channel
MPDALHIVVIASLLAGAWLISRAAALVARKVLLWQDRRNEAAVETASGRMTEIKRRETTVAMIRAAIAYAAFAVAAVFSVGQLTGGVGRLGTIAGASFVLLLVGFSIQRVLLDVIAGLMMFIEGWYHVGDTIAIPALGFEGLVEDVSLRRTTLRTVDGETIHLNNSQIPGVRVLPTGAKELAVELFVREREPAEQLVRGVESLLPHGPTTFVRRPWIEQVEELGEGLVRLRLRATVFPGREWLVIGLFAELLKERAGPGLIVHGPVVLTLDEQAAKSFARATAATRWQARPAPASAD